MQQFYNTLAPYLEVIINFCQGARNDNGFEEVLQYKWIKEFLKSIF
jgi:hypothetical protein